MHMNKRILSLTLALVMILGTFTAVFAEVTTVEQKAAEFLRDNGVLEGDEKGDLLLDKKLERRDAVVLSARLLGEEEKAENTKFDEKVPSWTDVRTDKFYVPFFAWAETTGRFEGKGEGIFEPRAGLTTQEYATVLLRILGHELNGKDAWKTVMALAEKEGLLENVDAKADDILMRGNMAVMTLNALGATVKGTGKTLADELNIKLPVPAKLEVEEVYSDNLKQIKVRLNKEANLEDVQDKSVYSIKGLDVERVNLEGNTIVIEVKNAMKLNKEYELVIKGLKDGENKLNHSEKFKAQDNQVPYVIDVEGLGNKALKVVMSEPVRNANIRDFKLDGKFVNGKTTITGNEIFVRLYTDMTAGDHTLTVGQLVDYNNFKSVSGDFDFEVIEDKDAPKITDVVAKTRTVVVTFDEVVDENTVNARSAYWKSGSSKKYADSAIMLSGNRVEFTFDNNELPLHEVDLFLNGIKDYSGNEIKEEKVTVQANLDIVRPEVASVELVEGSNRKIKVTFSKPVKNNSETVSGSAINPDNYYVKDEKDNKIKAFKVEKDGNNDKAYIVELRENLKSDKTYTLSVSGVVDRNTYPNMMLSYEEEIKVSDKTKPQYKGFVNTADSNYNKYTLYFSKEMDIATLSNDENYMIKYNNTTRVLSEITNSIEIGKDGKTATIYVDKDDLEHVISEIGVLGVTDLKGNKLSNYGEMVGPQTNLSQNIVVTNLTTDSALKVKTKEKVELEFNGDVDYVDESKISFSTNNFKLVNSSISGNKVTLNVEGLKADDIEGKTMTLQADSVVGINGTKLGNTVVNLKDSIAPELQDVRIEKATDGKYSLVTVFSRNVNVARGALKAEVKGATIDGELVTSGAAKEIRVNLKDVYGKDAKTIKATVSIVGVDKITASTDNTVNIKTSTMSKDSNSVDIKAALNEVLDSMDDKYSTVNDMVAAFDSVKTKIGASLEEGLSIERDGETKLTINLMQGSTKLESATKNITIAE